MPLLLSVCCRHWLSVGGTEKSRNIFALPANACTSWRRLTAYPHPPARTESAGHCRPSDIRRGANKWAQERPSQDAHLFEGERPVTTLSS
jgi:hypothetical protein